MYSNSIAGPSSASLMDRRRSDFGLDDGHREDDEAHLTANMSHNGVTSGNNGIYSVDDPENEGGATPRSKRKTVRYSVSPSPLKRTGTAVKTVTKSLRRMSLRVVNLANTGLEGQLRLNDDDDNGKGKSPMRDNVDDGPPQPDLRKVLPIRGRTLCFFGPESRFRLALFNFLIHP